MTDTAATNKPTIDTRTSEGWLQSRIGIQFNPEQARCLKVLCSIEALHNLDHHYLAGKDTTDRFDFGGHWLIVRLKHNLATYDGSALTRLVKAAHEHGVRVEISPHSMTSMRVALHARRRGGPDDDRMWGHHPTWEDIR